MNDDFRDFIVAEDPTMVEQLRAKLHEVGSFKVCEFAYSLGLYPPGYEEGQVHSIELASPPGHEGEPYVMWSVGLESPGVDDQQPEVYEDGENPWEGFVEITEPSKPDEAA